MKLKMLKKVIAAFCATTIMIMVTGSNVGAIKRAPELLANAKSNEIFNNLNNNMASLREQLNFIKDSFSNFETDTSKKQEIISLINNAENKLNKLNDLTVVDFDYLEQINDYIKLCCKKLFCIDNMELILQIGDNYISSKKGKVDDDCYEENDMFMDNAINDGNPKTQLINLTNNETKGFELLKYEINFVCKEATDQLINNVIEAEKIKIIDSTTDQGLKIKLINELNIPLDKKVEKFFTNVIYATDNSIEMLNYILPIIDSIPIDKGDIENNKKLRTRFYNDLKCGIKALIRDIIDGMKSDITKSKIQDKKKNLEDMLTNAIINEKVPGKFEKISSLVDWIKNKLKINFMLVRKGFGFRYRVISI